MLCLKKDEKKKIKRGKLPCRSIRFLSKPMPSQRHHYHQHAMLMLMLEKKYIRNVQVREPKTRLPMGHDL